MHPLDPRLRQLWERVRRFGRDLLIEAPHGPRILAAFEMEGFSRVGMATDAIGRPLGTQAWLLLQEGLAVFDPWRAWALAGHAPEALWVGLSAGVVAALRGRLLVWLDPGKLGPQAELQGQADLRPLLTQPAGLLLALPTPTGAQLYPADLGDAAATIEARGDALSGLQLHPLRPQLGPPLRPAEAALIQLRGSLGAAARLLGLASAALDELRGFCGNHRRFGRPMIEQQGLAFQLVEVEMELYGARLSLYRLAAGLDAAAAAPAEGGAGDATVATAPSEIAPSSPGVTPDADQPAPGAPVQLPEAGGLGPSVPEPHHPTAAPGALHAPAPRAAGGRPAGCAMDPAEPREVGASELDTKVPVQTQEMGGLDPSVPESPHPTAAPGTLHPAAPRAAGGGPTGSAVDLGQHAVVGASALDISAAGGGPDGSDVDLGQHAVVGASALDTSATDAGQAPAAADPLGTPEALCLLAAQRVAERACGLACATLAATALSGDSPCYRRRATLRQLLRAGLPPAATAALAAAPDHLPAGARLVF